MRKELTLVVALGVALCLVLVGCAGASTGVGETKTSDEQQATEREQDMEAHTYTTQEVWVQNGDLRIYGVAYVPNASGKVPLVIFSHELGNDHTSGERYAERLAEAGYATYVFDFCGGTVGGNKSDGSNNQMSVLTEASDLEAVLEASKSWDFVDPEKIVLLGGSMGGLVTTVVGSSHQDELAGMILMYPALSAKEDSGAQNWQSEDEVPEDVSLFGGWIHVGRNFVTDLWDVDFDQLLSSYEGHMLLLHGDKDATVPISWSEEAKEIIPDCEYHVIKDGGHEFFGQPFEDAMSYILPYLEGQLGDAGARGDAGAETGTDAETETEAEAGTEAASAATEAGLWLTIGETPLSVEWEQNESVEALKGLCQDGPRTIQLSMYGGFEQVGSLGQRLPSDDVQTTTQAGDIVLYSSNQVVVFYGSNSWAYTRLGHIVDKTSDELAELLGNGDVTITIGIG